jgi:hypothetical protein
MKTKVEKGSICLGLSFKILIDLIFTTNLWKTDRYYLPIFLQVRKQCLKQLTVFPKVTDLLCGEDENQRLATEGWGLWPE